VTSQPHIHQSSIAPTLPDRIEAIPVMDTEPDDQLDLKFPTCHLIPHEMSTIALCGDTVNAHTAIPLAEYLPGPRCHDCGRGRCERCVSGL
jgi:hypothetical protein